MRDLLNRRGFRLLVGGQVMSSFGDWMATVALMAVVLDITDSATAVAGILVLRLAPATLAGPLATRVVARWDRRRVMMSMDAARAAIVAAVPLVDALWWVYVLAFLLEVCGLVFLPARDAAIPDLAGRDRLKDANGIILASSYGTIPLGAAAFGIISALTPETGILAFGPIFWLDSLTFLAELLVIRRLTGLLVEKVVSDERPASLSDALRIPLVRATLPATTSAALGIGCLFSLGIVFVQDVLGASESQFGMLIVCFSLGAAAGLVALHRFAGDEFTALWLAVSIQGAVISVMSLATGLPLTFVGAAAFGAAAAAALASGMAFLQTHLRDGEMVAAFVAFHVVIRGGLSIAAVGAGIADDIIGDVDWPLVGAVPSTRVILFSAGVLVMVGAALARSAGRMELRRA